MRTVLQTAHAHTSHGRRRLSQPHRSTIPRFFLIFFTITVLSFVFSMYAAYKTGDQIEITVTDKERISTTNGGSMSDGPGVSGVSKFVVYADLTGQYAEGPTEEHPIPPVEVFENTDSMLHGKWDSANIQAKLKIGHTYLVTVYGWRVPFFSMFRNIVSVDEEVVG